jgi:hypothetical protein
MLDFLEQCLILFLKATIGGMWFFFLVTFGWVIGNAILYLLGYKNNLFGERFDE